MKAKKNLKFIIAALAIAIISFTFCACDDVGLYGKTEMDYPLAELYTVGDRGEILYDTASALIINIDWIKGDVYVNHDDGATTISFYEVAEGEEPTADRTLHYLYANSNLSLRYAKSGKFELGKLKKDLYVTLPADICIGRLNVDSVSGKVDINITGRIYEINVDSVAGNNSVNATANTVRVDSVSGNVTINGKVKNAYIDVVSGNTDVVCDESLEQLSVDTVSGNIRLNIPEDKGFTMEYDTQFGKLYNAFSSQIEMQSDKYLYLGGGANIFISTVSGSLTLSKFE